MKKILIPLFALVLFGACDKIDEPIPKRVSAHIGTIIDSSFSENNGGKRFVLVEEFTGHHCNNCPESAEFIEELRSTRGNAMISVSIHSGVFAEPSDGDKFTTDFRTPAGDTYDQDFEVLSYPRAMISRKKIGDNLAIRENQWEAEIDAILNTNAVADIEIRNLLGDKNAIESRIIINWLIDVDEPLNLQLFFIEDKVIDWQEDRRQTPIAVPDYEHRHVLRQAINGTFGQTLDNKLTNTSDTVTVSYPIPANVINIENCAVVAFIFKPGPEEYEVLQVNEAGATSTH
jgi:hypothetical protein